VPCVLRRRQVISITNIKNAYKNPKNELSFEIATNLFMRDGKARTFILRGESPATVVRASPVDGKRLKMSYRAFARRFHSACCTRSSTAHDNSMSACVWEAK